MALTLRPAPTAGRLALVTGGAGVMGARLVAALAAAGWRVRALVLPGDPLRARLDGTGCEVHEGDVANASTLAGACAGVDTVFHLAAVIIAHDPTAFDRINRGGTANVVAEAVRARVRHFVYVSSASVTYPKRTLYGESKLAAERIVSAAASFAHTIVRPTLVYDVGGGQEVMMFLDYLRRFPVVPFIGRGRARKRPVWAGDVVDGLCRVAGNAASYGNTYNFSGADAIPIADFARLLLVHHGMRRVLVPVPVPLCRAAAAVMGKVMRRPPLTAYTIAGIINDADLDPSEATRDLGYRPISLAEGLERCFPRAHTPRRRPATSLASHPSEGNTP